MRLRKENASNPSDALTSSPNILNEMMLTEMSNCLNLVDFFCSDILIVWVINYVTFLKDTSQIVDKTADALVKSAASSAIKPLTISKKEAVKISVGRAVKYLEHYILTGKDPVNTIRALYYLMLFDLNAPAEILPRVRVYGYVASNIKFNVSNVNFPPLGSYKTFALLGMTMKILFEGGIKIADPLTIGAALQFSLTLAQDLIKHHEEIKQAEISLAPFLQCANFCYQMTRDDKLQKLLELSIENTPVLQTMGIKKCSPNILAKLYLELASKYGYFNKDDKAHEPIRELVLSDDEALQLNLLQDNLKKSTNSVANHPASLLGSNSNKNPSPSQPPHFNGKEDKDPPPSPRQK